MHEHVTQEMFVGAPPTWALRRPKTFIQSIYDFVGAPLRMVLLPDHVNERCHLTSLRAERLSVVLSEVEGRCLDIGAGDNMLLKLYRENTRGTTKSAAAEASIGVDVFDWGGGCTILPDCRALPFGDGEFDTVTFVACINHIPERKEALAESLRVLKPGGKLIITMIGTFVGAVGHAVWWYSEDKHREIAHEELMGMKPSHVDEIVRGAGFSEVKAKRFVYGLNRMSTARKPG